jgi:uncharacterized surface protein with fasciclin (FAS1) repeats
MIFLFLLLAFSSIYAATIWEAIQNHPDLSTLAEILNDAAYQAFADTLKNADASLTFFAPTNNALELANLDLDNKNLTRNILLYHSLPQSVNSSLLKPLQFVPTMMNDPELVNLGANVSQVLNIVKSEVTIIINVGNPTNHSQTSEVVQADINCTNGYLHTINRALIPIPTGLPPIFDVSKLGSFKALLEKLGLLNYLDTLPSLTMFAPQDSAFIDLPGWENLPISQLAELASYHLVPSIHNVRYSTTFNPQYPMWTSIGVPIRTLLSKYRRPGTSSQVSVMVKGVCNLASVTNSNILTKNGVIHVIDRILVPPYLNQSQTLCPEQ